MSIVTKVLIVEKRDLLREKIAGILSREDDITMVIQVSSYSKLQNVLGETVPDMVIGNFFEFNKFCKETGITAGDLCLDASILLYTDETWLLNQIKANRLDEQKFVDVRNIQEEVKIFLKKKSEEGKR